MTRTGSISADERPSSLPKAMTSTHLEVPDDASSCPLGLAINTIGGRWKLHILRALLLTGPGRYNMLLASIDGISSKELTRNLRELETARLVEQVEIDAHDYYVLTTLGRQIEHPFRALGIFGSALAGR